MSLKTDFAARPIRAPLFLHAHFLAASIADASPASRLMGLCGAKLSAEQRAELERSKKLEEKNETDFRHEQTKFKLLLLGTGPAEGCIRAGRGRALTGAGECRRRACGSRGELARPVPGSGNSSSRSRPRRHRAAARAFPHPELMRPRAHVQAPANRASRRSSSR